MSNFLKEFKTFAMRGNVVDMAVGIIIGAAFGKIVTSLVEDIMMPPLGWLIGGIQFSDLSLKFPALIEGTEPVTWNYGNFIQVVIDFIIVAFAIYLLVRGINKISSIKKKEEVAEPAPSKEEILLTEIRDLLKNNSK